MTPAELSVVADYLRERFDEATAARMMRAVDGELEDGARKWATQLRGRPWTDHACRECLPEGGPMVSATFLCHYHRALALPDQFVDLAPCFRCAGRGDPEHSGACGECGRVAT